MQTDLEEVMKNVFKKPHFPVDYDQLAAKLIYHRLKPRHQIKFGDILVTPYQLDHPDPCWGYRFEHQGKVFSYCVDTECTRTTRAEIGPDLPLYQGVDLMVFDAQYSISEVTEKVNWGHAAAPIGLDIAMREGIKRVLFVHHDPFSSDEKVAAAEFQTRRYYEAHLKDKTAEQSLHKVDWSFAHEDLVIKL